MNPTLPETRWGRFVLTWGSKTYLMGVLNVTPDSFSGDGLLGVASEEMVVRAAVERASAMVADGADVIDVGGESTRPGAAPVALEEELRRVLPVLQALVGALPQVPISIDTSKAEVARRALDAGAGLVNDVTGLHGDPAMAEVIAHYAVPVVVMSHRRGLERYEVMSDTLRVLASSLERGLQAGIRWEMMILDPGFGFGLKPQENLELLRRLGELRVLGRPVIIGTSRKGTLGRVLGGLPVEERLEATAATVALSIAQGVDMVRVHDVRAMARVARLADAVVRGWKDVGA
jgi:dihydropteroate synthase